MALVAISALRPAWAAQGRAQALGSEDRVQSLLKTAPEMRASDGDKARHCTLAMVGSSHLARDGATSILGRQDAFQLASGSIPSSDSSWLCDPG